MRTIGVILAGGMGSRMLPLTTAISKHLLPVCGRAMLHWPIVTLANLGIDRVVIVVGGRSAGAIVEHFGTYHDTPSGRVAIRYVYQREPGGIPDALLCAREAVEGYHRVVVALGDNLFPGDHFEIRAAIATLNSNAALAVAKPASLMDRPASAYGCVPRTPEGDLLSMFVEKPRGTPAQIFDNRVSDCEWSAVLGLYVLPIPDAFEISEALVPSDRGELEIVDVLSHYAATSRLRLVEYRDAWIDAGDLGAYQRAQSLDLARS